MDKFGFGHFSLVTHTLKALDQYLYGLRSRWGAKWSVVFLLLPLVLFGIFNFGFRALLILSLCVLSTSLCGILGRFLLNQPFQWLHPGSIITGLLIGLTLSSSTPIYMILVGAVVAEFLGKGVLLPEGWSLLNPAVLGRSAIAVLETFDPLMIYSSGQGADVVSSTSPLFKEAGGSAQPLLSQITFGFTKGSIGETSALLLLLISLFLFRYVLVKKEAAISMILTSLLVVLAAPIPSEIAGHAPWVANPLYYILGGGTLLCALFFATDPVTIPKTRIGGILFGIGAGIIGVCGKYYTSLPGFEMYGILAMNILTPLINKYTLRPIQIEKDHPLHPTPLTLLLNPRVTSILKPT